MDFRNLSNGCNELLYFPRFTHTYVDPQVGLGQDVVNIKYFKWEDQKSEFLVVWTDFGTLNQKIFKQKL